jgi:hypothetical protein
MAYEDSGRLEQPNMDTDEIDESLSREGGVKRGAGIRPSSENGMAKESKSARKAWKRGWGARKTKHGVERFSLGCMAHAETKRPSPQRKYK